MDKIKSHISTALTRMILILSVVIGILFGVLQIVLDINHQKEQASASISQLIETIAPLASQAAYEMNEQAASEVLSGVMAFGPVLTARIVDDTGQTLAEASRGDGVHPVNPLYGYIYEDLTTHNIPLRSRFYDESVGSLDLVFDSQQLGEGILYRAFNILTFGIFRNIILALVSLFVFKWFSGTPLLRLTQNFAALSQTQGRPVPLDCPPIHKDDEFGALVRNINSTLEERAQFDEQLRRAQKMEAVGQLAGGIAHDFNNLLGIVKGNLELLRDRNEDDEAALRRIDIADRATERGADLTRKLLSFARTQKAGEERISPNKVIREVVELLPKSLTAAIQVEHKLEDDIWPVEVNAGELQDAIVNLALNARDAMPEGGVLSIETSNKVLDESYVKQNPGTTAGEFVMIAVSDTGQGIPDEIRERVIEPFFTTKSESSGTGLGLTMVYGFVQRSGGHMKVYSEEGIGTTFRIYLPYATSEASVEKHEIGEESLPRGSETILVVDDEPDLVELATAHLTRLGYKTVSASDGSQAIKVLQANPGIDLVFSDIVMPGEVDGYDLATRCLRHWPHIKVLLTSGFTQNRERLAFPSDEVRQMLNGNLLAKPYSMAELAVSVRKALDAGIGQAD